MKNNIILTFVFVLFAMSVKAQYQFPDKTYLYKNKDQSLSESHYLGSEIGFKMYVLKSEYTWQEEGTETSPGTKTYVEKPSIYNSVRKLSRLYKKEIKKGMISEEDAKKNLNKYLDFAVSIRHNDTSVIESELKKAKDSKSIETVFNKISFQ